MKKKIIMIVILFALLSSAHSINTANGDDPPVPTHGLTVDQHWFDIFQQDEHNTFYVDERIFFNNSGTDTFNGTIYAWLPSGSVVRSTCCGNALNMACRIKSFGSMDCFSIAWQDDNIIFGYPFVSSFLSYFGQRESLTVSVQSQNYSDTDTVEFNVTLGGVSEAPSPSNQTGSGIHVTSDRNELGVKAIVMPSMPVNLTLTQTINLTNNGTGNDTIDLEVLDLPQGWNASFLYDNKEINSMALNLTENKSVLLLLKVPSYIGEVLISYTLNLQGSSQDESKSILDKEFIYDNRWVESFVFTLEKTNLTVSDDLRLHYSEWNSNYNMTMNFVFGSNLPSGSVMSLTFTLEDTLDLAWLALLAVVAIFVAVIAFVVLGKRKKRVKEATDEKPEKVSATGEEDAEKIAQKKKEVKEALARLEADHEKGVLPDNEYDTMKEKLEERDLVLTKQLGEIESGDKTELVAKKKKMLTAILQLKKDHESGKISDEVYKELSTEYKKRTIDIMKQIDMKKGD